MATLDELLLNPQLYRNDQGALIAKDSSTNPDSITSGETNSNQTMATGLYQSSNFEAGVSGWRITADGDVEFGSGTFRGDITGASGIFSGNIEIGTTGYLRAGQTAYNTGVGFWLGYTGGVYKLSIGNPAGDHMYWDGTNLTISGSASLVGTLPWSSITNDGGKPANNATVGAAWGVNLTGIPGTLGTPSSDGLYLTSTYLGFYKTGAWNSYIDSSGNFRFSGDANSSIDWNITTAGTLTVKGKIVTGTGSTIGGSYITNATITGDKLVNATITATQIANATITATQIANATITGTQIASATIAASNIANATITATQIANAAITPVKTNMNVFIISAGNFISNSPIATKTRWQNIKIAFGGNEYTITDGNTTDAYIYWDYTNPNVLSTGATVPTFDGKFLIGYNNSGTFTALWGFTQVIGPQIQANSITASQITNATITSTQIASGTISGSNIANATIIGTNISGTAGILGSQLSSTAGIVGTQIANSTITGSNISNNTITVGKVSIPTHFITATWTDNFPTAGKVAWSSTTVDYNGTTYSITNGNTTDKYIWWDFSVSTTTFQTSATLPTLTDGDVLIAENNSGIHRVIWNATDVSGSQIQLAAITGANIANSTITGSNLVNNTITASQIANATITGSQIAATTIAGSNIINNTITATQIQNATITATQLANATITATQIATGTITSNEIANGTITGTDIASATITASNIANATITASQIANTTITASQIANLTITASQIANLAIGDGQIGSVGVGKLTTGTITSKTITLAVADGTGDSYIAGGNSLDLASWTGGDGSGGALIYGLDDSDGDKAKLFVGNYSTGQYAQFNGTDLVVNGSNLSNQDVFGDGSDGNVTISADTTLTSDMFYNNLTVNDTKTLNAGGYYIYVKNTLTNNGTISRNGNNGGNGSEIGSGGSAGAAVANGSLYGGLAGMAGGNGAFNTPGISGNNGTNQTESFGYNGASGGRGQQGGGFLAGSGGSAGTITPTNQPPKMISRVQLMREFTDSSAKQIKSSAGSGSGSAGKARGSSTSGAGGGSGSCGGIIVISSKIIINNGVISANGGNGGNGGSNGGGVVSCGGSGGGGGGGGLIFLIYSKLTAGTITVSKGTGGTYGLGYLNNVNDAYLNGEAGGDGIDGKIIYLQK